MHPGEVLREEFLLPLGLSSNALARALGVTAARINEIVREDRGITVDTALRLARYFDGRSPGKWCNSARERGVRRGGPAGPPRRARRRRVIGDLP